MDKIRVLSRRAGDVSLLANLERTKMEDQGIMALPQAGMQAPTQNPAGDAAVTAFEQARMEMDPREFSNELLSSAAQMDPAAVQEFVRSLQALNLPPEIIDALDQMVEGILADPQNYQENRAALIAEGVPEDFLPEQFDPNFFGALALALDQMAGSTMPMNVQQFADGGIARLKPIAQMLAAQGRNGDTMLAHITPAEARMLRRRGGSGTINPVTGLPEFFLKKLAKSIGNTFKSVGKVISNTVKNIGRAVKKFTSSTIGRLVTTIALGFFLGPAAASMLGVGAGSALGAAISGFVGSAGSTLLAGGNVKDALKAGVVGGLTAGAGSAVMGAPLYEAATLTPGQALAGQVDKFTGGLKSLTGAPTGATPEVAGQLQYTGSGDVIPGTNITAPGVTVPEVMGPPPIPAPDVNLVPQGQPVAGAMPAAQTIADVGYTPPASPQGILGQAKEMAGNLYDKAGDIYNRYVEPLTPGGIREAGAANAQIAGQTAYDASIQNALKAYPGATSLTQLPPAVQSTVLERAMMASDAAIKAATPGMFSTYAPIVAGGTALAYGAGMFDPVVQERPGIVPKETGFDLYNQNPELYGVTPGGAQTTFAPPSITPGYGTTYQGSSEGYGQMGAPIGRPQFQVRDPREYLQQFGYSPMGVAALAPRRFNTGGYASGGLGSMARKYPRRTGQISGPGTEKSDSIPAMLSDGEFVMTAKAVRGAGNGSRREGAKRMYQMMRKFEGKA